MIDDYLFLKGDQFYEIGKYEEAFSTFEKGALKGDISCMNRIALMYFDGEGVSQDYEKSIEWDQKAIELGDETAISNLAITYRVMGEIKKSKFWFEKAIEKGDGDAALELAKLYMVSDKETDRAQDLLNLAISSENMCEASLEDAKMLISEL